MVKDTTMTKVYDFYWKITSIIWGFIFLDFNGVVVIGTSATAGQVLGMTFLIVLSILAFATVIVTKDKAISNDLIVFGLIVPVGYVFWQITWLFSSIDTMIVLGMVGYYFIMNITSLVVVLIHKLFDI